jgi:hypothetical protein
MSDIRRRPIGSWAAIEAWDLAQAGLDPDLPEPADDDPANGWAAARGCTCDTYGAAVRGIHTADDCPFNRRTLESTDAHR